MKLMNLRRFDPTFTAAGRSGLTRGNQLEGEVWNQFHGDPVRLADVARAIREQVDNGAADTTAHLGLVGLEEDDDDFEAPEGRILTAPVSS